MGKNIILLSDGTGNGAAKRNKTNVWRLYDALDLHREDQVTCYDDGVGSQEFLPLKLLGGAFGFGLKRNVQQLYKFLCRTWEQGDKIYLFGFSRGAFTVRMLVGMIDYCGIYTEYQNDNELDQATRDNYNAFRSKFKSGFVTRRIRSFVGRTQPVSTRHKPQIEFIGVWDTVDAYGFPIDWMAKAWDTLIYPIYFPNYTLPKCVNRACHALSVDDERKTFHPVLWDESTEKPDNNRIEQVWFPGVHSDVGGGYPRYALSLVPLDWMLSKVEADPSKRDRPGLHFLQPRREEFHKHSDWHGMQHDSRAMFGAYYRYSPRDIVALCNGSKNEVKITTPKIHRSVFERIAGGIVPYAPTGLPTHYKVVSTDRKTIPPYETDKESGQRKELTKPVAGIITLRKRLYGLLLATSLAYLISPVLFGCMRSDQCLPGDGLIARAVTLILSMVPDVVAPWIKVLYQHPFLFFVLIFIFGTLFILKAWAWNETQQRATHAWKLLKNNRA